MPLPGTRGRHEFARPPHVYQGKRLSQRGSTQRACIPRHRDSGIAARCEITGQRGLRHAALLDQLCRLLLLRAECDSPPSSPACSTASRSVFSPQGTPCRRTRKQKNTAGPQKPSSAMNGCFLEYAVCSLLANLPARCGTVLQPVHIRGRRARAALTAAHPRTAEPSWRPGRCAFATACGNRGREGPRRRPVGYSDPDRRSESRPCCGQ